MSLMCDDCKCTIYFDDVKNNYHCENDCECCNNPEYVSPSSALASLTTSVNLAVEKLNGAIEALNSATDSDDFDYVVSQLGRIKGILESTEEVCEDCDNGTDMPCDYCLEAEKRQAMGIEKAGE